MNYLWRTRRVVLSKTVESAGWKYDADYNVVLLEKGKGTSYMYRLPDSSTEVIPISALEKLVYLCASDSHQAVLALHLHSQGTTYLRFIR